MTDERDPHDEAHRIKARLYDLMHHICNGRLSIPRHSRDKDCVYCSEYLRLKNRLKELADECSFRDLRESGGIVDAP